MSSPRNERLLDVPTVTREDDSFPQAVEETAGNEPADTRPDDAAMPAFAPPTVAGDLGRLGKYRIQKELGRGGMGAVYLAFDERLQRKVALKIMLPRAANGSAKERFLREARAAAQIDSDHVVNIFEADEIAGVPYIALQYLQGYPLDEYLKKKGLPTIPQVIRIGRETALGLAAAHQLGLVHRDIKPANLWLEAPTGRVKVLDFGLAKPVVGTDVADLTGSGAVVGTPSYMAPEQGMGKPVDGRADLFSLGCVLYRLCTFRLPFEGPTVMAILCALATEEPTPVEDLNPAVPAPLADLIRRLLAKKPAGRPQSATAVAEELAAMTAADTTEVLPKAVYVPMPLTGASADAGPNAFADLTDPDSDDDDSDDIPPPAATRAKPRGAHKWVTVGLAAVLAVATAGVIVNKIAYKDGTVTEIKVPDGAKIEVDGKVVPPVPKPPVPPAPDPKVEPATPGTTLPATFKNELGMEFVRVPKGTAWLGGEGGNRGDAKVEFRSDFHLGKYEVTQAEWEAVTGKNPSHFTRTGNGRDEVKGVPDADLPRHPVESVSWDDCRAFVAQLNAKVTEPGFVYRLPTAAEWEYACRGGPTDRADSGFDYYLAKPGNAVTTAQANVDAAKTPKRTARVGSYPPNALGLHDMHGNVWEWCDDAGRIDDGIPHQVHRGGGWFNDAVHCRAVSRDGSPATLRLNGIGLRLARVPVGGAAADPDRKAAEWLLANGFDFSIAQPKESQGRVDGMWVRFEPDTGKKLPAGPLSMVAFKYPPTAFRGDADLERFRALPHLNTVVIEKTSLSDTGLEHVATWPSLQKLYIAGTDVTDAGLTHLEACRKLELIHVYNTRVTKAGAEKLSAALPRCKIVLDDAVIGVIDPFAADPDRKAAKYVLSIGGTVRVNGQEQDIKAVADLPREAFQLTGVILQGNTLVSDVGLANFKDCKNLTGLNLQGTQVNGAGLDHFKECKNLTRLHLQKTKVTAAKFEELKKAFPKCRIESDHGTHEPK